MTKGVTITCTHLQLFQIIHLELHIRQDTVVGTNMNLGLNDLGSVPGFAIPLVFVTSEKASHPFGLNIIICEKEIQKTCLMKM